MKNIKALDYARQSNGILTETFDPLLKNTPVTVFAYIEYLNEQDYFHLCTDLPWSEEHLMFESHGETFEKIIDSALSHETISSLLWSTLGANDPMMLKVQNYGYNFGLNIYQKCHDRIRLWSFGGPDINTLLFFQSEREILEKFIFHFQNKAQDLIAPERVEAVKAQWSTPMTLSITKRLGEDAIRKRFQEATNLKTIQLNHKGENITITLKQWEYLKLFARGYSMKEIARILAISPRTVEATIYDIRTKTNLTYKSDFIELYQQNNFAGS